MISFSSSTLRPASTRPSLDARTTIPSSVFSSSVPVSLKSKREPISFCAWRIALSTSFIGTFETMSNDGMAVFASG